MTLYIVRHGSAEESNPKGDKFRRLLPRGVETVENMAEFLKEIPRPSLLLSSPFERARETAELFKKVLNFPEDIVLADFLFPESEPEEAIEELQKLGNQDIMLFGHNPMLSDLVACLVGDGKLNISLKKSAVACIQFKGSVRKGQGSLVWIVTPALLNSGSE